MNSFDVHPEINAVVTPYALTRHLRVPVHLNKAEQVTEALLDSGSMGNFINERLVEKLALNRTPRLPLPLLDVKGLKIGEIAFQVQVSLRIGSHEEMVTLDVAPVGSHQLILGLPWLEAHDPEIRWSTGHIQFTSPHCNANCLPQPHDVFARQSPIQLNAIDVSILVTRRHPEAQVPTRGSKESASWDLYSTHDVSIEPGHRTLVNTGISIQLPEETYGRIAPRSGLAWKEGITVGAGVVDRDYTGEIKVLLFNQGSELVTLSKGSRVAQLIPEKYHSASLKEVNQITSTERNSQGFGSTGIHAMEPDLVEIFAVDCASVDPDPVASMIPVDYHDFLDLADPNGPLAGLPPLRPGYDFEIQLDPTKPLPRPARPYHMGPSERDDWTKWRDTMLQAGHIARAPANTPTAAPFFFIRKKDRSRRPVIDYRKLNDITIKDGYPLPRIDEILERLHGDKIFSKFDLKNGYNLLRVKPEDVWKTAFMTPDGPFVMNVMAFGFANAPAYFQRWMTDILAPVANQGVENYLDDTATHHTTLAEHIRVNREVLTRFRQAGLFINAKKCEFHKENMGFLGVEISPDGFEMERVKIETIQEWEPPRNVKGVREFIGFCNFYRRFIKSFSEIARPLHDLTKVGKLWQWTEIEQFAFDTLKRMVCESPVLIHADPDKKFQMETDASSYAYGAVLSQKAADKKHHPVAFYSKSMTPAERNYGISDKEALPIIKGLQFWRHWLEGTPEPVRIITDHRNLEYFKNPRALNRRQLRWLEQLTHYNYEIAYRPGDKNSAADALSRRAELRPEQPDENLPTVLFDPERFIEIALLAFLEGQPPVLEGAEHVYTLTDAQLIEEIRNRVQHIDPLEWPPRYELNDDLVIASKDTGRIWVPPDEQLRREIVASHHDGKIAGHLGTAGTLELISRKYWWSDITDFTRRYVEGCHTCARNKVRNKKPGGLLHPLPVPEGPWLWTQSDFITQLPPSQGFDAIYVIADRLTKMAHFIPCRSDCTSQQLAELHVRHVWPLHGLPLHHNTDCGSQFTAPYMRNLYKDLGIDQRFSTAYHPESQGQVESNNKWLETYLRIFSAYRQDDWADYLHTAEFAYNNHHHPSIGMTPFYANYGYHPVYTNRAHPDQVRTLPDRLHQIHEVQARCQLAIEKAQAAYKRYADRGRRDLSFAIGDKVWLESYNLSTDAPSKKLAAKRLGPYTVLEIVGPASYRLDIPPQWKVHNVFHVGLLSRTKDDTIVGRTPAPQPVVRIQDRELWVIDRFVNSRWFRGKFQLKVRWEDQQEEQDDWRDYHEILAESGAWRQELAGGQEMEEDPIPGMIQEYYQRHVGAPRHDDPVYRRQAPPRHRAVRR